VSERVPPALTGEPAVSTYQRALDDYRRGADTVPALEKRMSELISLLDLSTTLSSSLSGDEILDAALLIVMGELRAARGCILVRAEDRFELRARRGFTLSSTTTVREQDLPGEDVALGGVPGLGIPGLEAVCLVRKAGRVIAVLGLAARADGTPYTGDDAAFLRSVAACAATPIENGLIYTELKQVNRRLSLKVFQLHNLFDITRELSASQDEESIKGLVTTALMGQLLVSRCALYLRTGDELVLAQERGMRMDEEGRRIPLADVAPVLEALRGAETTGDLAPGKLRDALQRHRLALAVPLSLGERAQGLFAVGERASGAPFGEEDRDFAFSLGRQALGALESVRLHRIRAEKERQDRELQFAREIQRSLFPPAPPEIAGVGLAAVSVPSQEVGGDHYDFIPLPGGRIAVTVADVSGKGTPASLLMASVHASLRALAGTTDPAALMAPLRHDVLRRVGPGRATAGVRERRTRPAVPPPGVGGGGAADLRRARGRPAGAGGLLRGGLAGPGPGRPARDRVGRGHRGLRGGRPRVRGAAAVRQPAQEPARRRRRRAGDDRGRGPRLDGAGRLRRRPDRRRRQDDVREP
jgi:GAF domain-containing protein